MADDDETPDPDREAIRQRWAEPAPSRPFAERIRAAVDAVPEEPTVRARGAGRFVVPVEDAVSPVLFGGEGAAGIDRGALARAREMQEGGTDQDAIWKETG